MLPVQCIPRSLRLCSFHMVLRACIGVPAAQLNLRSHSTSASYTRNRPSDFAFVFDIDGVLLRGDGALPHASNTLSYLQSQNIPFLLLTNGGGYDESKRAEKLSDRLQVDITPMMVQQSHTPFENMDEYKDKNVLVVGGVDNVCKQVAKRYGYKNVFTPSDLWVANRSIWPFSRVFADYHLNAGATPAVSPLASPDNSMKGLKIDAIHVYNDPRDWGLDITIIVDLLLSRQGYLGTISPLNNNPTLPNSGYQQDGQPKLFISNPDLWWASDYPLSRLGQGGFHAALAGVWAAVTRGADLQQVMLGKPHQGAYQFAENRLSFLRQKAFDGVKSLPSLKDVYMIGDNPESDIRGANSYKSALGSKWYSILCRTGVYKGGEPSQAPTVLVDHVGDAVSWALQRSSWHEV